MGERAKGLLEAPGGGTLVDRARYDAARVLPSALRRIVAGQYALHLLLAEAGAAPLPLEPGDAPELRDWDTPEDMEPTAAAPRDATGGRSEP
jgi:hypothetical protein